jgi:hypothetical protein
MTNPRSWRHPIPYGVIRARDRSRGCRRPPKLEVKLEFLEDEAPVLTSPVFGPAGGESAGLKRRNHLSHKLLWSALFCGTRTQVPTWQTAVSAGGCRVAPSASSRAGQSRRDPPRRDARAEFSADRGGAVPRPSNGPAAAASTVGRGSPRAGTPSEAPRAGRRRGRPPSGAGARASGIVPAATARSGHDEQTPGETPPARRRDLF